MRFPLVGFSQISASVSWLRGANIKIQRAGAVAYLTIALSFCPPLILSVSSTVPRAGGSRKLGLKSEFG